MNVEFVEKLKAALRANPEAYDQAHFAPNNHLNPETRKWEAPTHLCNSPVCLAGHAFLIADPQHTMSDLCDIIFTGHFRGKRMAGGAGFLINYAEQLLGMDPDGLSYRIFGCADSWPAAYAFRAEDGLTHAQQVERACAFLDALVAGTVEPEYADHDEIEFEDEWPIDDEEEDEDE